MVSGVCVFKIITRFPCDVLFDFLYFMSTLLLDQIYPACLTGFPSTCGRAALQLYDLWGLFSQSIGPKVLDAMILHIPNTDEISTWLSSFRVIVHSIGRSIPTLQDLNLNYCLPCNLKCSYYITVPNPLYPSRAAWNSEEALFELPGVWFGQGHRVHGICSFSSFST